MLFGSIAKANTISAFLSVILGVSTAFLGWGYWALVVLNLSAIVFNTAFLWVYCNWRPSILIRKQPVKEFLHFGAGISGFNIVNYITRYSDNVLIGARIGATALGFYTKAYQLLLLPLNQLRNPLMTVAIPAMSKLKSQPNEYVNYYRKYVFLLAFSSMPLVAYLAIFSKELILIVLGTNWLQSSNIFRVLAIMGFIEPVLTSTGLVMISTGQSKKFFTIGCITSISTITGFFIGIHWGVIGVATSFVVSTYLQMIPILHFSFKGTPVRVRYFFQEILYPVIYTLVMCALLISIKALLKGYLSPLVSFLILAPFGLGFYYLSWKTTAKGRKKLSYIDSIFLLILRGIRKEKTGSSPITSAPINGVKAETL
jgi:PST family polysaccharide transporter